jgi:2-polyprenyl-6-methoxyphenol hydroxylase-like FAD-dependent oxidoreductase
MPEAIVVGAGIGGLAVGVALRRAGWRVRVFERSAAPRELGFALNLAPNAIAALRALGVAAEVEADGHRTGLVEIRTADDRVLKRIDVAAAVGAVPSIVALRQTVHGALLRATPPGDLTAGAAGEDLTVDGDRATLVLAGGGREAADLLVGADGIGSTIRRRLHPEEPPPRPSGLAAIRGVVRGTADRLGDLSGVLHLGPGLEAAATRASADAVYWFVSVPLSRVPAAAADPALARARFLEPLPASFRAIVDPTAPGDVRVDRLADRDPLAAGGRGPVTLVGDAAHPMLPQTGQGAAQALEDAVALGEALAAGGSITAALRRYEAMRAVRTAALVRRGRRIAASMASESAVIDWLRRTGIRALPARVIAAAALRA